jgi:hypothetical protein
VSVDAIRAGRAFVEFFIRDEQIATGLERVAARLRQFGAIGSAISAPLIAAFTGAVVAAVSLGSELNDLSARTGLSVSSLSELAFAAQQTGTDLGAIERAAKALQANGISPLEFDRIAAELAGISDHTVRAQKAIEIFGSKAGTAILPLLQDLPKLREEARRLGIVMSGEDAAAADALGDAWDASKAQLLALSAQIGVAIAGPLTQFLKATQPIVASVISWIHENPRLVQTIAAVAGILAVASAAALAVGTAMSLFTVAMTGATAISALFAAVNLPLLLIIGGIALGIWAAVEAFDAMSNSTNKWATALEELAKIASPAVWLAGKLFGIEPPNFGSEGAAIQSQLSASMSGVSSSLVGGPSAIAALATGSADGGGGSAIDNGALRAVAENTASLLSFFRTGGGQLIGGAA